MCIAWACLGESIVYMGEEETAKRHKHFSHCPAGGQ